VPRSVEDGIASDPGVTDAPVGWLVAVVCEGLVSETKVPFPKMTRFVSIKLFFGFGGNAHSGED
jgi:hypothetical protein